MTEIKIGKIAETSLGMVVQRFTPNKRHYGDSKGAVIGKEYYQTTLKSLDDNKIDPNLFETIEVEKDINNRYLLKKGDIIMKISPPFSAAVIDFNCENLIGSSHFAIIRVNEEFDSEYLSFILNGKHVRRQLMRLIEGGSLSIIKISYLNEVKIRTRDKSEQKRYAKLFSLLMKRKELKTRVIEIEDEIIRDLISRL